MTTKIPAELSSTPGITDNSNATAITIDSSENVGIGTTSPDYTLDIGGSTPVIRIGDAGSIQPTLTRNTNTGGLTYNTTGQSITSLIEFKDNGSERMRIDSSGNVGIGTTSASNKLTVNSGSTAVTAKFITTAASGYLQLDNSAGSSGILSNGNEFAIFTSSSGTERMRITSSGVLAIGKTSDDSTTAGVWLRKHSTGGHGQIMCTGSGSSAYEGLYVRDITNSEMEFMASYHGTLYYRALASLSDERKKDNIQNITLGLDAVKELRPVSFDWKNNKGNDQLGFIAQEVETTSLKQLVSTYKDENIEDLRRLNKEGLIPVLVKAIQEQQDIIEDLKSRIETLEG
tara:strand:+ start:16 stop:1047 length:1032 start_codon:yes stop_codon:yes gene_type:complete